MIMEGSHVCFLIRLLLQELRIITIQLSDSNVAKSKILESPHEIMALFFLRKLIAQMHMPSHPVGLHVSFLVGPFVYFHTSCVRTAKALARLRRWAFPGHLCAKYHNLMSWLILLQKRNKTEYKSNFGEVDVAPAKNWKMTKLTQWENDKN